MMNWIEFITTMFTLGCDVSGYVGLVITAEQYKQITGKDYVAPEQAQMVIQSPQKHTVRNKSLTQSSGAFIMGGFKKEGGNRQCTS